MIDLISRQDAIDAVVRESQVDGAYGYMDTKSIVDLLHDMPTIKAQKTGKWITQAGLTMNDVCSNCGSIGRWTDKYCSGCGARMRGEE